MSKWEKFKHQSVKSLRYFKRTRDWQHLADIYRLAKYYLGL